MCGSNSRSGWIRASPIRRDRFVRTDAVELEAQHPLVDTFRARPSRSTTYGRSIAEPASVRVDSVVANVRVCVDLRTISRSPRLERKKGAASAAAADSSRTRVGARLECFELLIRKSDHPDELLAMSKAGNLRLAIAAAHIAERDFPDFESEFRGPEDEIEVAEWIEFAEIGPIGFEG